MCIHLDAPPPPTLTVLFHHHHSFYSHSRFKFPPIPNHHTHSRSLSLSFGLSSFTPTHTTTTINMFSFQCFCGKNESERFVFGMVCVHKELPYFYGDMPPLLTLNSYPQVHFYIQYMAWQWKESNGFHIKNACEVLSTLRGLSCGNESHTQWLRFEYVLSSPLQVGEVGEMFGSLTNTLEGVVGISCLHRSGENIHDGRSINWLTD